MADTRLSRDEVDEAHDVVSQFFSAAMESDPVPTAAVVVDEAMDSGEPETEPEDEIEATQLLDDEEDGETEEVTATTTATESMTIREEMVVTSSTHVEVTTVTQQTTAAVMSVTPKKEETLESGDEPASIRPLTATFGTLWTAMEAKGWQTAQGGDNLFVSMPGTQFFNFRPNINVFDSKVKACWKWIAASAGAKSEAEDDAIIWETLWPVVQKEFQWFTMCNGPETWYVQPNTRFEEFQPNVTIFQNKKLAVVKCLANQKVRIELGDSVEGPQVIDFDAIVNPKAPTKKSSGAQTPVSSTKKERKASGDSFVTPPPKRPSSASKASADKSRKLSGSGMKVSSKNSTGKSPNKPSSVKKKKKVAKTPPKPEAPLYTPPEFKCTFGKVWEKLDDRGWYYRPGRFEYDYFSPQYTPGTAILNGNYFQSQAEFEAFLKDSGLWQEIENMLREEHDEVVEELRQEAEERRLKRLASQPKKKTSDTSTPTPASKPKPSRPSPKPKKKAPSSSGANNSAQKRNSYSSTTSSSVPQAKITTGKVVGELLKRGWHYKPGRFEYDYFKPGVTEKTGKLNEDYFQSEADLEHYLKMTGLWHEIAGEIQEAYLKEYAKELEEERENENARRSESTPPNKKPRLALQDFNKALSAEVPPGTEKQVSALANDIWSNSNHFEFERY
ncbi:hypothetical protein Poli38472_011530 [Pythium oligandrum]|uniref:Uncharacterized protein n=1 Tax=Pythium oligandrum TaxID=41045 RepID=A0A8K1FI62_PYTOL|nr:hypothetical protein Poli38472_011530 [Pythium oligandrum]|eukprot:TMW64650.1 hypothetical protein Poli38472_011530 [Pythium oligandrum]